MTVLSIKKTAFPIEKAVSLYILTIVKSVIVRMNRFDGSVLSDIEFGVLNASFVGDSL